jgi:hypothetical protein
MMARIGATFPLCAFLNTLVTCIDILFVIASRHALLTGRHLGNNPGLVGFCRG